MNKKEVTEVMELVNADAQYGFDGIEVFDGYGLPNFVPVNVTKLQVAKLVRWQCGLLNGQLDSEELNNLVNLGRHRFNIIG